MGQPIYVDVEAGYADNGIMTMDTSGGGQENGYWLYWTENGYTAQGWYWNESNNYVKTGWENYVNNGELTCGVKHAATEGGLKEHIAGGHADDLNDVLGAWPPGEKMIFVGSHYNDFLNAGCLRDV